MNLTLHVRPTPLARALALAFGGTLALASAGVAAQSTQQPQKLDRIEITGSNIKRVDAEPISPVTIITREEIEQTGKATAAEVLRALPQNTGAFDEKNTNSFAPGSAGISLRGLGQKATLVLLNGRRIAGYGFAQNIQDQFVDLNALPTSAIERIEVLREGASAVYGSDAIAGVVNIIMRKDFDGVELGARYGYSSGLSESRVSALIGAGNLGSQKFNAFAIADYYTRGELMFNDRPGPTNSFDRRGFQGGSNQTSATTAGVWQTPAGGTNFRAISECPGVVRTSSEMIARGINTAGLNGTFCNYDSAQDITLLPSSDRLNLYGRATYEFSPTLSAYVDGSLSHNKSSQQFQYAAVRTTGFNNTAAGIKPFTYRVILPAGVGGNPTGVSAEWRGFFYDLDRRTTDLTSDAYRIFGGLTGTHFGWDWDAGAGYSETDTTSKLTGLISQSGLNAAIAANSYNFDKPSTNSAAVRAQISPEIENKGISKLTTADAKASRSLFALPGGDAAVAIGLQYRDESMVITPADLIKRGDILGRGQTSVDGSRTTSAGFVEFALPVLKNVEAQVAGRFDHYSDVGNSAVPKVGVKWNATENLLVRSSWGKGFRAPTLPEAAQSQATFFTTVNDPVTGARNVQISGVFSGNPNLKPEKSDNFIAGFVFEPTSNVSFGIDYFYIKYTDLIASDDFQTIVDNPSKYPGQVLRDSATGNSIVTVFSGYRNQQYLKTSGLDFEAMIKGRTGFANLTFRTNATYILKYDQVLSEGEDPFSFNGNNGPGPGYTVTPRFKANASLTGQRGPVSLTLNGTYINSYSQSAGAASDQTVSTGGRLPDQVAARMYWDLASSWQAYKGLTLTASILNITNKMPPFDPIRSSTYGYATEQYDVKGRTGWIGAKYLF